MAEQKEMPVHPFPAGLLDWAGNKRGGVRRLFDERSGRPLGQGPLSTQLLRRLEAWAVALSTSPSTSPRIVLLVGGPGNGKTEAIEATIAKLDQSLKCDGALISRLSGQLLCQPGQAVPRTAFALIPHPSKGERGLEITIVQDASVEESPSESKAQLLAAELDHALADDGPAQRIYLACVNRGVLDDAMIHVSEHGPGRSRDLIQAVIQAVGQGGAAVSCWPLDGNPSVALWPMDVESLFVPLKDEPNAAAKILATAIDESRWPAHGTCPAGDYCPFCTSRKLLASPRGMFPLLQLLRWHELATAKRWTFRDLYSLVSFLLAGRQGEAGGDQAMPPCDWAATLVRLDASRLGEGTEPRRSSAIFVLATSLYQHQLVGSWNARSARRLRDDMREVGMLQDHTAAGLYHFVRTAGAGRRPEMISHLLETLCTSLDPALADPASEVPVSGSARLPLREIDARFSQSVGSGLGYLSRHRCLSKAEAELLARLAEMDRQLSTPEWRTARPDAAARIQHFARDFACRLVRRSLGVRSAVTRDADLLGQYQRIVEAEGTTDFLLRDAAREVSSLLNVNDRFEVSLTTTFGQPAPPQGLAAMLVTARQPVKPQPEKELARPRAPVRLLRVGKGAAAMAMPLTFELYRSVRLLDRGLSRAALPVEVNALIDATKARLAGPVVRDVEGLDGAQIELGTYGARIELMDGEFSPVGSKARQ